MIEDILNKKYGESLDQLWIKENDFGLVLSAIVINKEARNSGIGSKVMTDLIEYSEQTNKIIALTPSSSYGGAKGRLTSFYKSFGFAMNKGGNKDFRFMEVMIRYPSTMNENTTQGGLTTFEKLLNTAKRDGHLSDMESTAQYAMSAAHEIADKWDALNPEERKVFRTPYYHEFLKRINKMNEDKIPGGLAQGKDLPEIANKHKVDIDDLTKQYQKGIKVEMEHTTDRKVASEIAMDHLFEDPKYYDKLETIEESTKNVIKAFLKEDVKSFIIDESPDTISVLIKYNDRNAGIIYVTPANTEDTMEIVGVKFKKDYDSQFIMGEAVKSLWDVFEGINSFIVSPELEGVEKWNKFGFSRISPHYLIANRGH
jgi:hypothetical protein